MTETLDDVLAHFGVRGMKWGVRKADTPRQESFRAQANLSKSEKKAEKKILKADNKWEKSIYTNQGAIKVHNEVADRMNNGEIDKHNSNPKWAGKNLRDEPELEKDYYDEYEKVSSRVYSEAVTAVHGSSPSGRKTAKYVDDDAYGPRIVIEDANVSHSDDTETSPVLFVRLKQDNKGHVIEANQATMSDELAQSDDTSLDDVLAHFGVKGMKWGVRKTSAQRSAPSEVKVDSKTARRGASDINVKARAGKGVVSTKGGKKNVADKDAVDAKASRQKAKASTTDALSNAELKKVVDRMQLEQKYRDLQKKEPRVAKGKEFIKQLFDELATSASK